MKVVVQEAPPKAVWPTYPRLMISEMGRIVLFVKPNYGVMLDGWGKIGEIDDYAEAVFKEFNGSVTLSNK